MTIDLTPDAGMAGSDPNQRTMDGLQRQPDDGTGAPQAADATSRDAAVACRCPVLVMLVDDQVIIAEALRQAFADEQDIDFHYCASAEDALQDAEETRPTVILQDLVMPGADGLTLVRQYRESAVTRDVPIIVLSSKEEPVVKSKAFAAGANDYLVKLPDDIELIARVRYHSRSYLNLQQRDEAYQALRQSQQQLLAANLELQKLTHSDGLTGLANRRYLDKFASAEWRRGAREKTTVGFVMIDVDSFKLYNDTYGHVAGDEVLKRVATAIESSLGRSHDLAARFGGEEFAVVLPGATEGGVHMIAEKIRLAVEALDIEHSRSAHQRVTISLGASVTVPSTTTTLDELIDSADKLLYRAKQGGKNQVVSGRLPTQA